MMSLHVVTPAPVPVVSLDRVKAHLRVDFDDEDDLLRGMTAAAVRHAEAWTGRTFVDTTYDLVLDAFPTGKRPLVLPRPPFIALGGVYVADGDGMETELDGVQIDNFGGRLLAPSGWPAGTSEGSIRIRYRAGYVRVLDASPFETAGEVPPDIVAAVLLYVGSLYLQRESLTPAAMSVVPWSAEQLLRMHRVEMSIA